MLSGRGLCDGLTTRPEESYRLWRVVCDKETLRMRRLKARYGAVENTTKKVVTPRKHKDRLNDMISLSSAINKSIDQLGSDVLPTQIPLSAL